MTLVDLCRLLFRATDPDHMPQAIYIRVEDWHAIRTELKSLTNGIPHAGDTPISYLVLGVDVVPFDLLGSIANPVP